MKVKNIKFLADALQFTPTTEGFWIKRYKRAYVECTFLYSSVKIELFLLPELHLAEKPLIHSDTYEPQAAFDKLTEYHRTFSL